MITWEADKGKGQRSMCNGQWAMLLMALGMALSGCSMIDEDLSDCETPEPPEEEVDINYELQLVTNMSTEIKTELDMHAEFAISAALKTQLSEIFSDFAHDVDLSFYDTQGDSVRLQHDQHIMDANQASYTLNLPKRNYMHLATANILDNRLVNLVSDDYCHPSELKQIAGDTIESHNTGLFTARLPMEVKEGVDQHFYVRLFMANCAAALVIDPRGYDSDSIRVYSTGFATGFNICDSSFQYVEKPPIVRTSHLKLKGEEELPCYYTVTFPSREPSTTTKADARDTRSVIETTYPFIAQPGDETLWEFRVYVPRHDGTITETRLRVRLPLRAGQLKIIRGWVREDGGVETKDQTVGVSVTLDWNDAGHHEVPL